MAPIVDGGPPQVERSRIPFVGCPSEGQTGPASAPKGLDRYLNIKPGSARQLAYYSSAEHFGTLAPRGWHCLSLYGSSGTFLYVSPQPIDTQQLLSPDWAGFDGPVVQLSVDYGGTSGRFEVAKTIGRIFPAHQAFVQKVVDEDIEPASSFSNAPYPADKLVYRSSEMVEYWTPANLIGLGTESHLQKNDNPVSGVAILSGEDTDLTKLDVRLQPGQSAMTPIIIHQIEEDTFPPSGPGTREDAQPTQANTLPVSTPAAPLTSTPTRSGQEDPARIITIALLWVFLFLLYWLPTIAAYRRGTVNKGGVLVVNLFFGWTVVGWVVALAMAYGGSVPQPPAQPVVIYAQNIYQPLDQSPTGFVPVKTIDALPPSQAPGRD